MTTKLSNIHSILENEAGQPLKHKIELFIPSTSNATHEADKTVIDFWKYTVATTFSNLFGGFTSYEAIGGWNSSEHGLIQENVTIIYSNASEVTNEAIQEVIRLAKEMKYEMRQEAISLCLDGQLYFI